MKLKSTFQRVIKSVLFIVISTWISLALLLYFFQPKLIFFPQEQLEATPALISLDYEALDLTTADGEVVNAWWVPHPEARATLLFLSSPY